jgi:hypothetical protein
MKSIYKVLAFTAMAAALATSCREVSEYQTTAFANLYRTTVTVDESVGTVTLPVKLSSIKGDNNTAVTFKVNEGTAKEGVNFTVEPAGKVLNFSDTDSLDITIKIIDQPGVYTGSLAFSIELESATNDYVIGGTNEANFTIKDNDHPLANILGTYSATAYGQGAGDVAWTLELSADDNDVTVVWCNYIVPFLANYSSFGKGYVKGVVNADKNKITFAGGQALDKKDGSAFNVGYGTFELYPCSYPGGYSIDDGDVVFDKVDGAGVVFKCLTGAAILDSYVWPSYGGFLLGSANGKEIVWTKK